MRYRPPVGRDRDGNKVDPNDAPRVYSVSADAWGNAVYTNLVTGEVTSDKPAVRAAKTREDGNQPSQRDALRDCVLHFPFNFNNKDLRHRL